MVKIIAIQMNISLNVEKNIKRSTKLLENAYRFEPDFVVYPEFFIAGPPTDEIFSYAQPIPGDYTERFSVLAQEYGTYIIMGTIPEISETKNLYDTSVLISPKGSILGKYRKIFLWDREKLYYSRGSETPVFNTGYGKIGIEICWDLSFPEISRSLSLRGADIIFCPSFWSEKDNIYYRDFRFSTEKRFIDYCVAARALENQVAFVYVNGYGPWKAYDYRNFLSGHTQVAIPFYGSISKLNRGEGIVYYDLDIKLLEKARKAYTVAEDLKEVFEKGLFKI